MARRFVACSHDSIAAFPFWMITIASVPQELKAFRIYMLEGLFKPHATFKQPAGSLFGKMKGQKLPNICFSFSQRSLGRQALKFARHHTHVHAHKHVKYLP